MTVPIDANIRVTDNGVKLEMQGIYIYPDGHANVIFGDGTNWPLADEYQVIRELSTLLRHVTKVATKAHTNA